MADDGVARTKQQSLQQAASVIFALVAVVPLLIFAWTLHALGAIGSTQAQVSLALALTVALLGFWMFRSMLTRMAAVVQSLAAAVQQGGRLPRVSPTPGRPGTPTVATPAGSLEERGPASTDLDPPTAMAATPVEPAATAVATGPGAGAPSWFDGVTAPRPQPAVAPAASRPAVSRPTRTSPAVAGIGSIRELTDVVRAMDALWRREAMTHLGKRVQISVANRPEPLIGTLSEASADGLILEQADRAIPVSYGRVTAIDRLS